MEASGRDSLRSGRIPPREMDPGTLWIGHWAALRVPMYVVVCMAKRKKTKMPVKREAHPCDSYVQIVCFKQHGNDQDMFILQYEVVMGCTGTSITYLDRKTEQVVSDVSHADSSGGARFQSLSGH